VKWSYQASQAFSLKEQKQATLQLPDILPKFFQNANHWIFRNKMLLSNRPRTTAEKLS